MGAPSWTALLAATTIGLDPLGRRRVRVHCDPWMLASDNYRLVVHLYEATATDEGPNRPRASAQRAVTAEELKNGVDVTLHEPLMAADSANQVVVVAWVELGEADLDFDGAQARPVGATYLGRSEIRSRDGNAQVVLRHQAA